MVNRVVDCLHTRLEVQSLISTIRKSLSLLQQPLPSFPPSGTSCPANIPRISPQLAWDPRFTASGRTQQKHRPQRFLYCCWRVCRSVVLKRPFVNFGCYIATAVLIITRLYTTVCFSCVPTGGRSWDGTRNLWAARSQLSCYLPVCPGTLPPASPSLAAHSAHLPLRLPIHPPTHRIISPCLSPYIADCGTNVELQLYCVHSDTVVVGLSARARHDRLKRLYNFPEYPAIYFCKQY